MYSPRGEAESEEGSGKVESSRVGQWWRGEITEWEKRVPEERIVVRTKGRKGNDRGTKGSRETKGSLRLHSWFCDPNEENSDSMRSHRRRGERVYFVPFHPVLSPSPPPWKRYYSVLNIARRIVYNSFYRKIVKPCPSIPSRRIVRQNNGTLFGDWLNVKNKGEV